MPSGHLRTLWRVHAHTLQGVGLLSAHLRTPMGDDCRVRTYALSERQGVPSAYLRTPLVLGTSYRATGRVVARPVRPT